MLIHLIANFLNTDMHRVQAIDSVGIYPPSVITECHFILKVFMFGELMSCPYSKQSLAGFGYDFLTIHMLKLDFS